MMRSELAYQDNDIVSSASEGVVSTVAFTDESQCGSAVVC